MKKIVNLLIFVIILVSIGFGIYEIANSDIYEFLICLTIIPIVYLPKIIRKIFKFDISNINEIIFIVFVFLAHFLGSILNFYNNIYFYDKLVHFLSGMVVAIIVLEFLVKNKRYDKNYIFNILFILGMSFMIAGFWEYFEYICDFIFKKDAQNVLTTGINDTMQDMLVATLGTILFLLFNYILKIYQLFEKK